MGQVRIDLVKKTGRKLIDMYPKRFTEDFDHNKDVLETLIQVSSKRLRNKIAGYITNLVSKTNKTETILKINE